MNRNLTLVLFVLVGLRGSARDHEIDPRSYYRLTNSFLGPGRSLDTYSDGENALFMGQTGSYSERRYVPVDQLVSRLFAGAGHIQWP